MRKQTLGLFLFALGLGLFPFLTPSLSAADLPKPDPNSILVANGLVANQNFMVHEKILSYVDEKAAEWKSRYESLKTIPAIEAYQKTQREYFIQALGESWPVTPLNPQVTGTIVKPNYRVEKIIIETHPNFYATGTLYLPLKEKYAPPYPAALLVCGHTKNGKASADHQTMAALGAANGLAVFDFDPIEQGERFQRVNPDGTPVLWGTGAHNMAGATSILLGRNTASFEVWDNQRALDYLQSRPDIIADKLGVLGNSGGGTQTSYLMALDDRVQVAAPCCYLCSLYGYMTHVTNPQDAEQNIFGQLGHLMDHPDYPIMRAPKPTLMCCKTQDFFGIDATWDTFRYAKRIFSRFHVPEQLCIVEMEGPHGYCPEIYNAAIRWMLRWLTDRDQLDYTLQTEGELGLLTDDEMRSVQNVQGVMSLPNARTTYDLNRDFCAELKTRRQASKMTTEELAETVRKVTAMRKLAEIPEPKVIADKTGSGDFILETEKGIFCPVRQENMDADGPVRLVVSSQGRRSGSVANIFAKLEGPKFAVDLRGWGETQNVSAEYFRYADFGTDGIDFYGAYLLGKSFVGMRAEDLLVTVRYLRNAYGKEVEVITDTPSAALVALHANAAELGLISKIHCVEPAVTWTSRVESAPAPIPMTDLVHGALNYYDVDDLEKLIQK